MNFENDSYCGKPLTRKGRYGGEPLYLEELDDDWLDYLRVAGIDGFLEHNGTSGDLRNNSGKGEGKSNRSMTPMPPRSESLEDRRRRRRHSSSSSSKWKTVVPILTTLMLSHESLVIDVAAL